MTRRDARRAPARTRRAGLAAPRTRANRRGVSSARGAVLPARPRGMPAASLCAMRTLRSKLGYGLLGGVAGLLTMELVKRITAPLVKQRAPRPTADNLTARASISAVGRHHGPEESATDAIGRILYENLAGRTPSPGTQRTLSWAVHIGYGLVAAALYGVIRGGHDRGVARAVLGGALFGAGLWLLGDELAAPLLGLSDNPTRYPVTSHLQSLAQHLGFGVATAATTGVLLDGRRLRR
jgi:hypothetical protein